MHTSLPGSAGFKRQVVFRIGIEDWPLLEAAACEHGSIQSAVLAVIRALTYRGSSTEPARSPKLSDERDAATAELEPIERHDPKEPSGRTEPLHEEITGREAAKLLGLKTSTVSGYIRSGRLPGRHDGAPTWLGWLTTRAAVESYRSSRSS